MLRATIRGTGSILPPRCVKNEELAPRLGVTPPWIRVRTGVEQRYYTEEGIRTSDLALEASKKALEDAGLAAEDLDLVIFGTLSPDCGIPGNACFLQEKLGIASRGIPALDLRQQCSAFIYGLEIAQMFIETGKYHHILLVGAEIHSAGIDFSERGRDVTPIFGDGAGAVVLGAEETDDPRCGIIYTETHADGRCARDLCHEAIDASRRPILPFNPKKREENRNLFPRMDGRVVTVTAVNTLADLIPPMLEKNALSIDEIDWILPHQANIHINNFLALKMGIAKTGKVLNNIDHVGNTTAASIPILLDEYVRKGTIKRGDMLLCVAFGAGFTWGGALLRF